MNKKGFTLIELLGVMIILAVLTVVVFPSVINFIKSSNEKQDKLVTELVYNAMDLYIKDYNKQFLKIDGTKYSISLKKLVSLGYIKSSLLLSNSDEDLVQKKCIEVTYSNGFNYEMKDECEATHYVVDYDGIDGTNYQTNIAAGQELKIEFTDFIPPKVVVYADGERLNESEYTYENNILTVDNAKGNIEVEYKEKVYLVTLPENTYFKEDAYRENIKSIKFLDYIDTGTNPLVKYDLSVNGDGSIIAWIDKNYNLYIGSDWEIYSTDLSYAFSNMTGVNSIQFDNLNTSENNSLNHTFYKMSSLNDIDISNFNTNNVTSLRSMFAYSGLEYVDLTNFKTINVTDMSNMFHDCLNLQGVNLSSFDTSNVRQMHQMFMNCPSLKSVFLDNFNTQNLTTIYSMFNGCTNLTSLNLSSFNTVNINSLRYMFANCNSLSSVTLDSQNFNTTNVTDMTGMFYQCKSLKSLDLSWFDTTNLTTTTGMFNGAIALEKINLAAAKFNSVTTYANMFSNVPENISIDINSEGATFISENFSDLADNLVIVS